MLILKIKKIYFNAFSSEKYFWKAVCAIIANTYLIEN
jgi:hypothetical protein